MHKHYKTKTEQCIHRHQTKSVGLGVFDRKVKKNRIGRIDNIVSKSNHDQNLIRESVCDLSQFAK